MATKLGQLNINSYVQITDNDGVITELKFKTTGKNTVTAGYDNTKVTFKNNSNQLSVEAALSAGTCTGNAATATKLATAHTVTITNNTNKGSNTSFDGSNNISIELPTDLSVIDLTASSINGTAITSSTGNATHIAASQKLATDISSAVQPKIDEALSAVQPKIDEALTNYTAYELDDTKIQLKNMKLVKYQAIYEDKTAEPFDFYVFKPIA